MNDLPNNSDKTPLTIESSQLIRKKYIINNLVINNVHLDVAKIISQYDYFFEGKQDMIFKMESTLFRKVLVLPNNNLVSKFSENTLKILNTKKNLSTNSILIGVENLLKGHNDSITCFEILPNDKLISGSFDCVLKIWNLKTKMCIHTLTEHNNAINYLKLLKDGRVACGDASGEIKIWNINTFQCESTLVGHTKDIIKIDEFSDNRLISGSDDFTIKIWSIKDNHNKKIYSDKTIKSWELHEQIFFVLSNDRLIYNPNGETLRILNNNKKRKNRECCYNDIALSEYCNIAICIEEVEEVDDLVIVGFNDGTIRTFNSSGKLERTLVVHNGSIECIVVLIDHRIVSGSHDNTLRVWDLNSGTCDLIMYGHSDVVWGVVILPDGRIASYSGCYDNTIRIWK